MSGLTKKAIIDVTISLAERKPFNRITVRDIVTECGITRNTFYYYFRDIYDVIDQALKAQIEKYDVEDDVEKTLFDLTAFVVRRKKVFLNMYRTLGHDKSGEYIMEKLHTLLTSHIAGVAKQQEVVISDEDVYLISAFYEEALFGILSRWLTNTKNTGLEDIEDAINRIKVMFDGEIEHTVANCKNLSYNAEENK